MSIETKITNQQLRDWANQISIEGRTEFSHCHVMPMIKEIQKSRALIESLEDNIWTLAVKAGFEIKALKE